MTRNIQDIQIKLSCYLDNELERDEINRLCDQAKVDDELKKSLANYALISHALKTGEVKTSGSDLWIRVSENLKQEPTLMAPKPKVASNQVRGLQPLFGYGLAASLLVLALTIGKSFVDNSDKIFHQQVAQSRSIETNQLVSTAESRFDDYLLIHNGSTQFAGTGSVFPYARLVGSKTIEH